MNIRRRLVTILALSVGLAAPLQTYAISQTPQKSRLSRFLGAVGTSINATKYSLGVAVGGGICYYASTRLIKPSIKKTLPVSLKKWRKHGCGKLEADDWGELLAGSGANFLGLKLMGWGAKGLKRLADGEEKMGLTESESEKQVNAIVDATKRGTHFGARLFGYGVLAGAGAVLTVGGLLGGYEMISKIRRPSDCDFFTRVRSICKNHKLEGGGSIGAVSAGVPMLILGLQGMIKTCKGKKEADEKKKEAETKEVAVQTDDDPVVSEEHL